MAHIEISVAEFHYYFDVIEKYFGLADSRMHYYLEQVRMNPMKEEEFLEETMVYIQQHISFDEIKELLDNGKLELGTNYMQYATLVFLVANIYYGDSYSLYMMERGMTDEAISGLSYDEIRKEVLELYLAIKQNNKAWSWSLVDRNNWERSWNEAHREERIARRKIIIKQLEKEYGEIIGEDWKEREAVYIKMAERQLDQEMGQEMRAEKDWKELDKRIAEETRVHLRFGRQKGGGIPGFDRWIIALFENHVFPRFIPEIENVEMANDALKSSGGRPPEDIRVRVLSYGFSEYFYKEKIIATKTSRALLGFLQRLFKMMDIHCLKGEDPSFKKIEDAIQNVPNTKEDRKFYSEDDREIADFRSFEDPRAYDIVNWLFSPEVVFKHRK